MNRPHAGEVDERLGRTGAHHVTRVALIDGQQVMREALATMLATAPDIEIVGSFRGGVSLLESLCAIAPDVVVMEANLPDGSGLEWAQRVKSTHPDVRILILTSDHSDAELSLALELGVDGFLYKEASAEDLFRALRSPDHQGFFASPQVARRVRDLAVGASDSSLTAREMEVLLALRNGLTAKEASRELHVATSTVKSHLTDIYRKLGVRNRVEAIQAARSRGLVV